MPFSRDGKEYFSVEVGKLLGKGAMRRASFDPNQFLSIQFKILRPCQRIQFLGFTNDSSSIMFSLPQEKLNKLIERAWAT